MEFNWDEVLQSPELCKLIYENLGVSKKEWNAIVKNQDFEEADSALLDLVSDTDACFYAVCECDGYGSNYYIHELCGLYFTNNPDGEMWGGPMSIDCIYNDIPFFYTAIGHDGVEFTIKSSLDDDTVFKIIGVCDRPITLNGAKYLHDGKKYVPA